MAAGEDESEEMKADLGSGAMSQSDLSITQIMKIPTEGDIQIEPQDTNAGFPTEKKERETVQHIPTSSIHLQRRW